jgi:hypothetical protein
MELEEADEIRKILTTATDVEKVLYNLEDS